MFLYRNLKLLNNCYIFNKYETYKYINNVKKLNHFSNISNNKCMILGIETSCDDTGSAIVDNEGNILGEGFHSQLQITLRNGGVIPPIAQELHRKYIEPVVDEALKTANITYDDINAIAVTVKPGLPLSLSTGLKYAKYLSRIHNKPLIPIHHMEAHALTVRMENDIDFPYLCLLISGGHCLLTLINDVNNFLLLGESLDNSPGEAFDKASRRLKLGNIKEFANLSGGAAIEKAAKKSKNPDAFVFTAALSIVKDCNFSISGYKSLLLKYILQKEKEYNLEGGDIIPEIYDLCAGLLIGITRHLCHRTQRAMDFIRLNDLIPEEKRILAVSGGVACNDYIYSALQLVCNESGFKLIRPKPKLCTDNGVMIGWNGVEKWKKGLDIIYDIDSINFEHRSPLGKNISDVVTNNNIKCKNLSFDILCKLIHSG